MPSAVTSSLTGSGISLERRAALDQWASTLFFTGACVPIGKLRHMPLNGFSRWVWFSWLLSDVVFARITDYLRLMEHRSTGCAEGLHLGATRTFSQDDGRCRSGRKSGPAFGLSASDVVARWLCRTRYGGTIWGVCRLRPAAFLAELGLRAPQLSSGVCFGASTTGRSVRKSKPDDPTSCQPITT